MITVVQRTEQIGTEQDEWVVGGPHDTFGETDTHTTMIGGDKCADGNNVRHGQILLIGQQVGQMPDPP
jgi:hypothetical protein